MSLLHERIKANYWKGVEAVGAILYLRMMDLDLLTHLTFKLIQSSYLINIFKKFRKLILYSLSQMVSK